ncbi:MAG: response regulator [Ktedonobacterales bacterium]|nr:response regulator [Ktedonobacterales bacterium]
MRVLIVDDDDDIRLALRMVLEDEGYSVAEAENGQAALDVLMASDEPLVVIVDYRMPVMDGPALLQHIDQHPPLQRHRAFILMSGVQDSTAHIASLLTRLPMSVLPKPFDINDVMNLVGHLVDSIVAPVAVYEPLAHDLPENDLPT